VKKLAFFIIFISLFGFSKAHSKCFVQIATYRVKTFAMSFSKKLKGIGTTTILKPYNKFYVLETKDFDDYNQCIRIKALIDRKFDLKTIVKPRKATHKNPNHKEESKVNKIKRKNLKVLYLEKAKVCMGEKQCDKAVNYLKLAIEKDPNNPKLFVYLGYAYMNLQKYDLSEQAFRKAISIDPHSPEGFAGIGLLYLKQGNYAASEIAFEKAYELNPHEISYGINYAISLMMNKKYAKAEELLKNFEELYSIFPEIHYNLGLLFLKENRIFDAKREFKEFLALTSDVKFYRNYRKQVKNIIRQLEK
jgi:Tfp pilus assembly protein PilF